MMAKGLRKGLFGSWLTRFYKGLKVFTKVILFIGISKAPMYFLLKELLN